MTGFYIDPPKSAPGPWRLAQPTPSVTPRIIKPTMTQLRMPSAARPINYSSIAPLLHKEEANDSIPSGPTAQAPEAKPRPVFRLSVPKPAGLTERSEPTIDPTGKASQEFRLGEAQEKRTGGSDRVIKTASLYEHVTDIQAKQEMDDLIDDDFPFDDSQLAAIELLARNRYGCITGAAGTGKTTVEKGLVARLHMDMGTVNLQHYWKSAMDAEEIDDSDRQDKLEGVNKDRTVSAIALCAYTGRASQMIKANFPDSWHSNIMTIHRMLAFQPEYYEDLVDGEMKKKMRFIPTYTAANKMPWDAVVIDEAGMLSTELWIQLFAACKPGCRIYMIGDINQLPPTHGTSIFGYAMANWPTAELTHIHRQKGVDNPIVDNAWRILKGLTPKSCDNFQLVEMSSDPFEGANMVRSILMLLKDKGVYDPMDHSVITAINGEVGQKGYDLGQLPLNEQLALMFNPQQQRTMIDAGRERKDFAVGDKVMVTRNDHTIGITNGMTGVVEELIPNPSYQGDMAYCGTREEMNARLKADNAGKAIDTQQMLNDLAAMRLEDPKEDRKRDRGAASHIVRIRFSPTLTAEFKTFAEVASLQVGYVITCHKSQGGEYEFVVIIVADSHKFLLNREWLYTATTRASVKVLMLYNRGALAGALNKQRIKGSTLKEKVASFNQGQKSGLGRDTHLPPAMELAA